MTFASYEVEAAISASKTKHGRFKYRRETRAKERYNRGEIERVIKEAR